MYHRESSRQESKDVLSAGDEELRPGIAGRRSEVRSSERFCASEQEIGHPLVNGHSDHDVDADEDDAFQEVDSAVRERGVDE